MCLEKLIILQIIQKSAPNPFPQNGNGAKVPEKKKSNLSAVFKVPETNNIAEVSHQSTPPPATPTRSITQPSPRPKTLKSPPTNLPGNVTSATQKQIWQARGQIKELECFLTAHPV